MNGYIFGLVFLLLIQAFLSSESNDFFQQSRNNFPSGNNNKGKDSKDLYKVLGLQKTASSNEIKAAYRKLATKMHPDRGGDEEQFKKLVAAYEVLSDPKKKQVYDLTGNVNGDQFDGSFEGGSPFGFSNDIRSFFRGFGGFNMPVIYNIELTLEDYFNGRAVSLSLNQKQFSIQIQPGMGEGMEIRSKISDEHQNIRDIVFVLQEKQHSLFTRHQHDLHIDLKISLLESIIGFERTFQHLDGNKFTIYSHPDESIAMEDVLVVPGLGMPIYQSKQRGKLVVNIHIDLPSTLQSLSSEDRQALIKILSKLDSSSQKSKTSPSSKKIPRHLAIKSPFQKRFTKQDHDDQDGHQPFFGQQFNRFFF